MKRILFILMLALFATGQVSAQMSDEEVVEFVKNEHEAGKSQTAILLELQKKGVKKEQLLRLKEQYEAAQGGSSAISSKKTSSGTGDRLRKPNGNKQDNNEDNEEDIASITIANITNSTEFVEEEKRIFGHDIFKNEKLSFEPNMNIATPANYILGPGDEILIDIYGTSQTSSKYSVSPEGTIIVDKIGPVGVAGLTVEQAQRKVSASMGQHYQGSNIKLTVGQTRTVLVNILGEVSNPGTYTLSAFSTVFNALYAAGGITDIGTLRNIKVSREGRIITKVDVYDYLINGKLSGNIMLQDNDAIIVDTYDALVLIEGAIKRPMYYEMKDGEVIQQLLTYAGGFNSAANSKSVIVERKGSEGLSVHLVEEPNYTSFSMQDGDSVSVKEIIGRYTSMVEISGAVFYPGHYSLSNDCNSVRSLVQKAGGVTEEAFINRAVLFRMNENRTRRAMSIDLAGILSEKAPDVILENEDSIAIASNEEINKARKYFIYGPIITPGAYNYVDGMTLEDAIVAAGGLREEALLTDIEVARRLQYTDERDTTYNQKAHIYTFNIEDGLLVKEGQDFQLKPFDIITIKRNPEYADISVVYIGGEVKYPGNYSLRSRKDRLSDLIERAGGLTDAGFADGARFSRSLTRDERERAEQLLEMAHSADTVDIDKIEIKDRYPVGIDLNKALREPGCDKDIILRNGDQILIPQRNNTVRISGEVLYPNTIAFIEGKSPSYYINQAGGVSTKGQRTKAFIIYANGQVSRVNHGRVKPGCEIVVPTKPDRKDSAQKTSTVLAGVSTLSTVGAIILSALKR